MSRKKVQFGRNPIWNGIIQSKMKDFTKPRKKVSLKEFHANTSKSNQIQTKLGDAPHWTVSKKTVLTPQKNEPRGGHPTNLAVSW
jgi:hypothetical protein